MKNPSIYLAVALVFVLGLFVGQTTAQDPVRIDKPGVVHVLPDQNIQELSDLLIKHWNPPEIKDDLIGEMWRRVEGNARVGEPGAALVLMRIRAHQHKAKK
ncbi:MAG: hypothetical protein ACYTHK_03315 [Planctomycetota bacterium]|jgi:hypothetical protein